MLTDVRFSCAEIDVEADMLQTVCELPFTPSGAFASYPVPTSKVFSGREKRKLDIFL